MLQGECVGASNECTCFSGYGGAKCEYSVKELHNEEPVFKANSVGWYDSSHCF